LRATVAAVSVRAEVAVRGLPAAGRARVLPPLERETAAAGGVHAVRLDAREPYPPAVGDGGLHLDLRGDGAAPRRAGDAAAVSRDLGRAVHATPALGRAAADVALAGVVRRVDQALPAGREHAEHDGLVLFEREHRRVPARSRAAAAERGRSVARRSGARAVREARAAAGVA